MNMKNDKDNMIKNYILNIFYHILLIVTPLLTSPYLSRVLGKEGMGSYQYTYTIAGYFAMLCLMGIRTYGVRECARCKDDVDKRSQIFWELYSIQFGVSAVSVLIYCIYILAWGGKLSFILLIQGGFVFAYALDITWLYYGLEEFATVVIRDSIVKLCSIVLIFLFVRTSEDVAVYCMIMAGSALFSQVLLWSLSPRYIIWKDIKLLHVKKHIKSVVVLFFPIIGIRIYSSVDKIMLGTISGLSEVGLYGTAEGIANMPYGIITAFSAIMMPRVSSVTGRDNQLEISKYRKLTMQVTMLIAFPVCAGLAAVSEKLIPWYLAEEFAYCATVLRYLVVILVFLAWSDVIQKQYIIPLKKDNVLVKGTFLTACINVVFNYIFIPRVGIMGAVYGTILSEAFVMVYFTMAVRHEIDIWGQLKSISPYFLCSLLMYYCVIIVGNIVPECSLWITLLQVGVGIAVYVLFCTGWIYMKKTVQTF